MQKDNLKTALLYASWGWHVFPVNGKIPFPKTKGFKDASSDPVVVAALFNRYPGANIGIATGPVSKLFVVDIDVKDNKVGEESIAILQAQNDELPATVESETWSGGRQMFFRYPQDGKEIKNSQNKLGKDIDIRGDGGYVVAPPSIHNDKPYSWLVDPEFEPMVPAPEWLLELLVMSQNPESTFKLPKGKIPKGKQDEMLFKYACSLKAQKHDAAYIKLALGGALALCDQDPKNPFTEKDVARWINSAFNYPENGASDNKDDNFCYDMVGKGINKKRQPTYRNLEYILSSDENLCGLYCFNEFSEDLELCKMPPFRTFKVTGDMFDDNERFRYKSYIIEKYNIEYPVALLQEGITKNALDHCFHPIKNYLESLVWDNKPRLNTWLVDYAGAINNEYTRDVSSKMLIAACKRIYKPGCKYDHMVILEGEQGVGKSQLVNALGAPWSAEISLMAHDKDTIDKLRGKWIIEVPELTTFKKQDIQSLKAFLTTLSDRVRLAYRMNAQDFPRRSIFIGTINPEGNGYLNDPTGGRRFFPIEVTKIDLVGLKQNKDQLFAEAYHRFKQKENIYITCIKALKQSLEVQLSKAFTDVWYDNINSYVRKQVSYGVYKINPRTLYVNGVGLDSDSFDNRHSIRIGNVMKQLGWEYKNTRVNGAQGKRYVCPEVIKNIYREEANEVTNGNVTSPVKVTETQSEWKPDF